MNSVHSRFLHALTDRVRRSAVAVAAAALVASAGCALYLVDHLRIDTDIEDMLSPDLPFRRDSIALSRAFPLLSDNLIVVVDGATPDVAEDAVRALARRLQAFPDRIRDVFDPHGGAFLRANGLLFLDEDALRAQSDRLAEAQPFLGTLWRDPTLRGLAGMLDLLVGDALDGAHATAFDPSRALVSIAAVAEAQAAGEPGTLSWHDLMTERAAEPGEAGSTRRLLVLRPVLDYSSLSPAGAAMTTVRGAARDLGLTPAHGVRVRLTGSAALAVEELESVQRGIGLAAAVSLLLVVVLLLAGLGSVRAMLAVLLTLVAGLVWTATFAAAALDALNLISVAFAVLFIGLGVDFGIHYVLRYREGRGAGGDHEAALREAASRTGGALTLCAVSSAIAFYAFLPTDYDGLAQLGVISGTGMFIALFASLTVLPALLTLLPPRWPAGPVPLPGADACRRVILRHRRVVLAGFAALVAGAAALAPRTGFDFDPLGLKDPASESVSTLFDLDAGGRPAYEAEVLAADRDAARVLAARLAALPEVEQVVTIDDFVPAGQDGKLAVIDEMGIMLLPALDAPAAQARADAGERAAALESMRASAARLAAATVPAGTAAQRLERALESLDTGSATTLELERRLLSGLAGRVEALRESLAAAPFGVDDLPPEIAGRMLAADGRARVVVDPRGDLRDREALRRFVNAVRAVAPRATGDPVVILEAGEAVIRAFVEASLIASASIAVLLLVLLRRVRDVALVFVPVMAALVLTLGVTGLTGLAFNFANVIVLPLLFGLSVDAGLHLVLRARTGGAGADVYATSTPRAVALSALTTVASFASLMLSHHPGTASMGLLLTIALAFGLVCTLVLLPALLAPRPAAA